MYVVTPIPSHESLVLRLGPIWLFGSLFIFQGPYFHCFGFIQVKNVNSVGMYCIQQWVNLICLCWVKSCTIIVCPYLALVLCYTVGIKFHKSFVLGPYLTFIISQKVGSLFLSLEVPISFRFSAIGQLTDHSQGHLSLSWVRGSARNLCLQTHFQAFKPSSTFSSISAFIHIFEKHVYLHPWLVAHAHAHAHHSDQMSQSFKGHKSSTYHVDQPETLAEWKFESVTDGRTNQLTYIWHILCFVMI